MQKNPNEGNPNEGIELAMQLKEQMIVHYIGIIKTGDYPWSPLCPALYYQSYNNMREVDTQYQIYNCDTRYTIVNDML